MNENQENKHFSDDGATEPLTKKVAKFSAFIYLGLAITVVIVATVGIFSISYDYETEIDAVSFPDLNFNTENSQYQGVLVPDTSESPVINEESGVDATLSEPEPEPRVMYYKPVSGKILKNHSSETLVYSATMDDYRVHYGIDVAAEIGTEVVAFTDGVVSSVTDDYFYGTTVAITHDYGVVSYYMNLDPALAEGISEGTEVLAGEPIGKIGGTARIESADESHLHFELWVNGVAIDPVPELP